MHIHSLLFFTFLPLATPPPIFVLFFFNDTATTEIYTLSLHDALPICTGAGRVEDLAELFDVHAQQRGHRSEEHTSELQSPDHLVCRLLLEKKKRSKEEDDMGFFTLIVLTSRSDLASAAVASVQCLFIA